MSSKDVERCYRYSAGAAGLRVIFQLQECYRGIVSLIPPNYDPQKI